MQRNQGFASPIIKIGTPEQDSDLGQGSHFRLPWEVWGDATGNPVSTLHKDRRSKIKFVLRSRFLGPSRSFGDSWIWDFCFGLISNFGVFFKEHLNVFRVWGVHWS